MNKIALAVALLVVALAVLAESSPFRHDEALSSMHEGSCGGLAGTCLTGYDELLADDITMRRSLAQRGKKYISYEALRANSVPCGRRGASYYACGASKQVNPYNRGCSVITHCYRFTG